MGSMGTLHREVFRGTATFSKNLPETPKLRGHVQPHAGVPLVERAA
jgi:hypothetical protein